MIEVNKDNFAELVENNPGLVVVDLWGPQCGPCIALMPDIEKLAATFDGKISFTKLNVAENRRLCIQLKVMSVPTFLFYAGGECKDRLSGDEVSLESVAAKCRTLLGE